MSTAGSTSPAGAGATWDLDVGGMTCASCAARVEKRLNRIDGVTATVNYATALAHVDAPAGIDPTLLVAEVEAAGYTARVADPAAARGGDRRHRLPPGPPGRVRRPHRPGGGAVDGAGLAVRPLAVAGAGPGHAGGALGRLALPPGGVGQPPPPDGHHGHPHLPRHPGRLRLVAGGAVLRLRRRDRDAHGHELLQQRRQPRRRNARDLPGGGRRRHRVHPGRPLPRGPGPPPVGRGAAGPARARRQGRGRPRGGRGAAHPGRAAGGGDALRRPAGREGRHRRRRGGRHVGHRRLPADRRERPGRGRARATRSSAPRSTPAGASSSGPPGSGPTPPWPASPGSSPPPSPGRPPSNGWPTGCRPCSYPS